MSFNNGLICYALLTFPLNLENDLAKSFYWWPGECHLERGMRLLVDKYESMKKNSSKGSIKNSDSSNLRMLL